MDTRAGRVLGASVALALAALPACGGRVSGTMPAVRAVAPVLPPTPGPSAPPAPEQPATPTPVPAARTPVVVRAPVRLLHQRVAAPRPALARASDGLFGIEIPSIGLRAEAHEGQSAAVLRRGPGHLPDSALPGQVGNVVIPGHRTVDPHPFLDIDKINVGDQVILTNGSGRFVYDVTGTAVVPPDDWQVTMPTSDPTLTLYACHPRGSDTERYVVFGRLDGPAAGGGTPPQPATASSPSSPPSQADDPNDRSGCGVVPCVHQ